MTRLDLAALLLIGLSALAGFRRGLIVGACSLGGLAAGAYLGAKVAPVVVRGHSSVYPPLVTFAGAVVGSGAGQFAAVTLGRTIRRALQLPLLRVFDNIGGLLLGLATGIAFVWVAASVLLYLPADGRLRGEVQRSSIAGGLTTAFPPSRIIGALVRIDPFQSLAGPAAGVAPGDPALLARRPVAAARLSVVRIVGIGCGLGVEGTGWVVAPSLVVTNAHVVAGITYPLVDHQGGRVYRSSVVAFDATNDLALLRVPGLHDRPLPVAHPDQGVAVAVLGFPENGPFTAVPGRLGTTAATFARDAYGRFPVTRTVTTIRAHIQPGNSGGPVVDTQGRVRAVVFARRANFDGGYGVPVELVVSLLHKARTGEPIASDCSG